MLRFVFLLKLWDYPESMILQQDGAPPHYANEVRENFDWKLSERWMGRVGPISWPAHSPDLTLCDYYLWGYVNDIVYRYPLQIINELKKKIREAIRVINEDTLERVFENMLTRLNFVIREKGWYFEHFMN